MWYLIWDLSCFRAHAGLLPKWSIDLARKSIILNLSTTGRTRLVYIGNVLYHKWIGDRIITIHLQFYKVLSQKEEKNKGRIQKSYLKFRRGAAKMIIFKDCLKEVLNSEFVSSLKWIKISVLCQWNQWTNMSLLTESTNSVTLNVRFILSIDQIHKSVNVLVFFFRMTFQCSVLRWQTALWATWYTSTLIRTPAWYWT